MRMKNNDGRISIFLILTLNLYVFNFDMNVISPIFWWVLNFVYGIYTICPYKHMTFEFVNEFVENILGIIHLFKKNL